jgi:hypothetical protein
MSEPLTAEEIANLRRILKSPVTRVGLPAMPGPRARSISE